MRIGTMATGRQEVAHAVISNMRPSGSLERFVGANGEINAGSKVELLSRIVELSRLFTEGAIEQQVEQEVASPAERTAQLLEAYHDHSSQKFAELGASIAAEVQDRLTRAGFSRRFLARGEVTQGSIPRVRIRQHNVSVVAATGVSQVRSQYVRDKYILPNEFSITGNVMIDAIELNQGSSDLLQEKFLDAQENFMVQEDRVFKRLADTAAPIHNNIQYFAGAMTPANISAAQNEIVTWSLSANTMLMAADLLPDLTTGSAFSTFVDPVSKLEIIQTGRLGTVLGLELVTDGFREQNLQVLTPGEFYVLTSPSYLGAYTDRGPIQAEPRSNTNDAMGRGWFMGEVMSMAVANAKGVCKGVRL